MVRYSRDKLALGCDGRGRCLVRENFHHSRQWQEMGTEPGGPHLSRLTPGTAHWSCLSLSCSPVVLYLWCDYCDSLSSPSFPSMLLLSPRGWVLMQSLFSLIRTRISILLCRGCICPKKVIRLGSVLLYPVCHGWGLIWWMVR